MASSLDRFAADKVAGLEAQALRRTLSPTARQDGVWLIRGGRRLLSFSCNDYLGLSQDARVTGAAQAAAAAYGTGAGASRLVTGNHPLYTELEGRLAALKGTQSACVFGSGYLANAGIIPVLAGEGDVIFADALSHACLWAGAQLSRAHAVTFRHNDMADLAACIARERGQHRHALILTDTVFSMDGDLAPLPAIMALAAAADCWVMSDDAHGLGVTGGGHGPAKGVAADLQMGTLSKALASYGGYVCASAPVIELIRNRARTLIYSTGLPPSALAAALAALDIIAGEPERAAAPLAAARAFTAALDLPPAQSPIVPLVLGGAEAALAASALLEEEGFAVIAIRPPTVPEGTARLRFAFNALHRSEDVARLADIVRKRIIAR